MAGLTLLERAESAGLSVRREGDDLVVEGPAALKPLALALLERKPAVLAQLQARTRPAVAVGIEGAVPFKQPGASRPCYACGHSAWWRLRHLGDRADWICGRCHPPLPPETTIEWAVAAGGER